MEENNEAQQANNQSEGSQASQNGAGSSQSADRVEEVRQAVVGSASSLMSKVLPLLKDPKQEWPKIKARSETTESFYKDFLIYMVAISPVCSFIGMSIVGRTPFFSGLMFLVMSYALGLATPFIFSFIAQKVAPMCEGEVSSTDAIRLIGYAASAGYIGGFFNIIPVLAIIGTIISLYSIYLLYTGVPVMTSVPQNQVIKFMAIVLVAWIVVVMVLGLIVSLITLGATI